MKSVITAICLLIPLVIIFVIIDHKDFYLGDDVVVQQETVTRTKPSTTVLDPVEQPAETKPVEVPTETKPVTEIKPTETKLAETKPVAEIKPPVAEMNSAEKKPAAQEKSAPAAVPVVTAEKARTLNVEALAELERQEKRIAAEKLLGSGEFALVFSDHFNGDKSPLLSKTFEDILKEKGYDVDEFKKRRIPSDWTIEYYTIPADTSFRTTDDGYSIVSPKESICFIGQRMNGMRSSFRIELTVKNLSDEESEVSLGIHNTGPVKNGHNTLVTEKINSKEIKTIKVELSVFEQFALIAPTVSVKGSIVLTDLSIYRRDYDEFTIVEGEIIERSALPAPEDTDYPDCRYTAHFVGKTILSGMPCNKELALSIDGFLKKKLLPTTIKPGDKIRCAIIPVASLPDDLASIQEADDLSLFNLDSYFVTSYYIISSYSDFSTNYNASIPFKSDTFEFTSAFNQGFNPPIPESVKDAQNTKIKKDLEEANKMIAYIEENKDDIEKRFQDAWTKEKKRFPDGFNTIKNGSIYWRNIDNSFWCLPSNYSLIPQTPYRISKDRIDAIVAFKDFLESNGVQLIVSLVPDWYEISSRIINPAFKNIPDLQCAIYVKQLSEAGIECPYEVTKILENYNRFQFAYFFPSNDHPSTTTQYSIAEEMVDRLSRYDIKPNLNPSSFSHAKANEPSPFGVFFPSNCDIGTNDANEEIVGEMVYYDGKLVQQDPSSKIIVFGNSTAYSPGKMTGGQHSFSAFLSEKMLYPVDDYIVGAEGPMTTLVQRVFEHPDAFLKDKRVVILQMPMKHAITTRPWNNIAEMDRKRLKLNGKKLVDTFHISGNGDYANEIVRVYSRNAWKRFEGKNDIKCFDDQKFEIFDQVLSNIDTSKPIVCAVQTLRIALYDPPTLIVNGHEELIPATHDTGVLFWQDVYFDLPAGTSQLKIELQGKKNTLVGFNKVLIFQ